MRSAFANRRRPHVIPRRFGGFWTGLALNPISPPCSTYCTVLICSSTGPSLLLLSFKPLLKATDSDTASLVKERPPSHASLKGAISRTTTLPSPETAKPDSSCFARNRQDTLHRQLNKAIGVRGKPLFPFPNYNERCLPKQTRRITEV